MVDKNENTKSDGVGLKRNITLTGGIAITVGTMIGSGIFISPTGIIGMTGSVGSALIVWCICGFIAIISSLSYIELGLLIQEAGAEYSYCYRAYGSMVGFIIGWTNIILCKPASLAVIVSAFAEYTTAPFYPGCDPPNDLKRLVAICALLFISIVNGLSVKASERMQIVFTIAKLFLIAAIIIGGFVFLGQGNTENFQDPFAGTSSSASAWAIAIYNGMWSYDGWNQLNYVSEELIDPVKNFPIVVIVGMTLTTVAYVLTNIAYFAAMSPTELLNSNAVAITFGDRVFKGFAWIVPIGVACSTFGASNGSAFTAARLSYAAASNGHFPRFLSYLSHERLTPLMAVVFNTCLGVIMLIPDSSSISNLLDYFSFAMWLIYFMTFVSLIVFRFKEPYKSKERAFRIWLPIPIICACISAYLVIGPLIEYPTPAYAIAAAMAFGGLIFYFPFVYFNLSLPFRLSERIEIFCQKFFEVVPIDSDKKED